MKRLVPGEDGKTQVRGPDSHKATTPCLAAKPVSYHQPAPGDPPSGQDLAQLAHID